MKIAIISYTSRQEGCLNGVERFNWYLQKAIGGEIYTATMFRVTQPKQLNSILLGKKLIDKNTLCIVDGAWGLGIPKDIPVISIVHGSWKEFCIRNKVDGEHVADDQEEMWHRPNINIVAVSEASAKYLYKHHKVKVDKVILNGVDTEVYKPLSRISEKTIVLHCARDYNKDGGGKLDKIKEILKEEYTFKFLNAPNGLEYIDYQMADVVLQCSNYEGNSYFMLEGMSCGLPVVASRAGLFEDTKFNYLIGRIVDYDASPEVYANEIRFVARHKELFKSRQWIEENASIEKFNREWKEFISGC